MFYADRKTRFIWSYALRSFILVLGIAIFLRIFLLGSLVMHSNAMAPQILPGDFIISLKKAPLGRGKVYVYSCFENEQNYCARRLIGLPGDRVELKSGQLWLNGELLGAEFGQGGSLSEIPPLVVPPHQVFVLDDNRSQNASVGGLISQGSIQGRAWRIWLSLDWYVNGEVQALPKIRWQRVLQSL